MNNKRKLNRFSTEMLNVIEEVILSSEPLEIINMIEEIRKERAEQRKLNWNFYYKVEDLTIDFDIIKRLKENNISTLQELIETDIHKIPGITQSAIEQLEWAILFFDMRTLQKLYEKDPNTSQLDAVKDVIIQGEKAQKQIIKKYNHEV